MPIFFISDIEGSTKKWEKYPEAMKKALLRHDEILTQTIKKYEGTIIKHTGDGVFAVFEKGDVLTCTIEIQKRFEEESWPDIGELRIRIGLHAGQAERRGDDFFGPAVNRTARVMAAAWGGQILVTPEVIQVNVLPDQASLKDLGAHVLKDLGEPQHIYQLDHSTFKRHDYPALRSLSAHPHNLPIQSTPFFGRGAELEKTRELLQDADTRLISIVGPGGMGKTRLALQAAADQIESFSHGIYLVPLAPLTSANALVSSIADTVKFFFYSKEDERVQLLDFLREKEMLLILDNFEHVMSGVELIGDILGKASGIKILVTSREILNLRGESVLHLQGMSYPEDGQGAVDMYSAVQLFIYNARRVKPAFVLTEENKQSVSRVCQLVGGLPLGVELAASWMRLLSCTEIVKEIEKSLDFLETSQRDLPERHRSLRAIFDYSWNLLSEDERKVLQRLAIFQRGFTRKAAEQITGASLTVLAALVDKSLLRIGEEGRYELSPMVMKYALENLAEDTSDFTQTSNRHCEYYLQWLGDMNPEKSRALSSGQIDAITIGIDNVRAAWKYGADHQKLTELEVAAHILFQFMRRRGFYKEGVELVLYALERMERHHDTPLHAWLLYEHGRFIVNTGDLKGARRTLERSLSILRKLHIPGDTANTLLALGDAVRLVGDLEAAKDHYEEALRIYRESGDTSGTVQALNHLAFIYESKGDYQKGRTLAAQSLALAERLRDDYSIAISLNTLGMLMHGLGEYGEAKDYYLKSIDVSRRLGEAIGIARALNNSANIFALLGDREQARLYYEECLKLFRDMGNLRGAASALSNMGLIAQQSGKYEESLQLFEEAHRICRDIGYRLGIAFTLVNMATTIEKMGDYKRALRYDEEALTISRELGDTWALEITLGGMGSVLTKLGDFKRAKEFILEAFEIAVQKDHKPTKYELLLSVGTIWQAEERQKDALEVFEFIACLSGLNAEVQNQARATAEKISESFSNEEKIAVREQARSNDLDSFVNRIISDLRCSIRESC